MQWTGKPYSIGKDGRCLAVLSDSETGDVYALVSDVMAHRRVAAAGPLSLIHTLTDAGTVDYEYLRHLDYHEGLTDWVAAREWHLIDGVVPIGDGECLVAVLGDGDSPQYALASPQTGTTGNSLPVFIPQSQEGGYSPSTTEGVFEGGFSEDVLRHGAVNQCG